MNYEEYIGIIEKLKNSNDLVEKEKIMNSSINESLIPMIEPKLIELIKIKYQTSVNKMVNNLESIFSDKYNLDQYLVNFKKEISFIYDLTKLKELTEENRKLMQDMVKNETKKVYNILIDKANAIDITGVLGMTIKNNEIKWGE